MIRRAHTSVDSVTRLDLENWTDVNPVSTLLGPRRFTFRQILALPGAEIQYDDVSSSPQFLARKERNNSLDAPLLTANDRHFLVIAAYFHDLGYVMQSVNTPSTQLRAVSGYDGDSYVIIDRKEVALFRRDTNRFTVIDDPNRVRGLLSSFDHLWQSAGHIEKIYDDPVSTRPADPRTIFTLPDERWDDLIRHLSNRPEDLYDIDPRKFEELVAELLRKEGMKVRLTPTTRDGGRDILAIGTSSLGVHLHLVECKRYAPHRPIRVERVRSLYGVIEAEKATAGLLVTTSYFTRDAHKFRNQVKHRLSLKDYNDLVQWLKQASPAGTDFPPFIKK